MTKIAAHNFQPLDCPFRRFISTAVARKRDLHGTSFVYGMEMGAECRKKCRKTHCETATKQFQEIMSNLRGWSRLRGDEMCSFDDVFVQFVVIFMRPEGKFDLWRKTCSSFKLLIIFLNLQNRKFYFNFFIC